MAHKDGTTGSYPEPVIANWGHDVLRDPPRSANVGSNLGSFFLTADEAVTGYGVGALGGVAIDSDDASLRLHVLTPLFAEGSSGELGCEQEPAEPEEELDLSDLERSCR